MGSKNEDVMNRRKAEKRSANQRAFCEMERIARILCYPIVEAFLTFGSSKLRQVYERQVEREQGSEELFVAVKRECHSQRIMARDKCIQALAQNGFIQFAAQVQGERFVEAAVGLAAELGCQEDFEL